MTHDPSYRATRGAVPNQATAPDPATLPPGPLLGRPPLDSSDDMTTSNHTQPIRSLGGSALLAVASVAIAALGASCGAGLAGGASAASSGDDPQPEGARLDLDGSLPVLSLTQFQEPTRANEVIPGAVPAEPSNKLVLQFSDAIQGNFSSNAIGVEIKRPGGAFIPVEVVEARAMGSNAVEVTLSGDTLHNSLYRVRVAGLMSSGGAVQVPTTNAYFVVRDGEWQQPEFITASGGGFSGGVTIAGDLEHYSTLESYENYEDSPSGQGKVWGAYLLSAEFGSPWLSPPQVYGRIAEEPDERGLQPQTGSLVAFDEVGMIRVHESHPLGPESINKSSYLRVAVGPYLDSSFSEDVRGYQFGPTVEVTSKDDPTGLVDRPGAAFGPTTDHFSFNGTFAADGRNVAASFWALTELDGNNEYTKAKVYANAASVAPFNVGDSLSSIDWAVWDPAVELSDPGEDFNSWPLLRQLPDGRAIAMWWSASSLQNVLEGTIEKYWLTSWSATGGWSPAVDVSPSTTGPLGMITDLRYVAGPNGTELVVFSRSLTGPAATHLDLTSMTWGIESRPMGTTSIPESPTFANFSTRAAEGRYRNLLGDIRRTTPKATSIGNGEFIVRWIDSQSGGIFASIYKPATTTGMSWDTPVDLTMVPVIDPTDPVESAVDLLVDTNGWATLIYRQRQTPGMASSPFEVYARRANLAVNSAGASAFATASTEVRVSREGDSVSFPSASNVHSSGAFSVVWSFQSQSSGSGVGSSLARFR